MNFDNYCTSVHVPNWRAQDIDTKEDWIKAKKIFEKINKNEKKIKTKKQLLKIIDKIEKVRSRNNINWMDLIRLSIKFSPKETSILLRK